MATSPVEISKRNCFIAEDCTLTNMVVQSQYHTQQSVGWEMSKPNSMKCELFDVDCVPKTVLLKPCFRNEKCSNVAKCCVCFIALTENGVCFVNKVDKIINVY